MASTRAILKHGLFIGPGLGLAWMIFAPSPQRVTTQPSVSEVVGRYTLSSSQFGGGVDSEIQTKANDAYIELHPDGQATLHQVPIIPESSGGNFAISRFHDGSCMFEIGPQGGTATQTMYGVYFRGIELPDPMWAPRFKRLRQSWMLSFEYFDGDFTERMVFTRRQVE